MSGKALPSLSPAEWDVMNVLWDRGPLAARDVHGVVGEARDWSIQTLKTVLSRLVTKGAVDYVQVGNSYLYRAAVARDEMTRVEAQEFVGRVFQGSAGPAVAAFLAQGSLSQEDVRRLRSLLDELEGRESNHQEESKR